MNSWLKLVVILCVSVAICSLISHGAIRWFGIRHGHGGYQPYGQKALKPTAILYCSSLGYDGIDWGRVSEALQGTIESWATAGSSPSEWDADDRRSPGVTHAFIAVSPYDLNEYWLCDVRAEVVPLGMAIRDLRSSDVDGEFSRRVLSQYPLMVVRKLFPTVGRSDGVMVGIREKLRALTGGSTSADVGDAPKFGSTGASEVTLKVTDWSPGQLQRRIVLMRDACQGKHSFNGPKALALRRLLQRAIGQGQVTMVVMPVSPFYRKEFLSPHVTEEFEGVLVKLQPPRLLSRFQGGEVVPDRRKLRVCCKLEHHNRRVAPSCVVSHLPCRPRFCSG
ncbi:MAG: hypothetical protein ABSC55_20645 [Syntrophorhabdales bacterium]